MRPLPRHLSLGLLALGVSLSVGQGVDAVTGAWGARSGRDFATYHYATQAALSGDSPYNTRALGQLARQEGTRKSVHPYFYPPPALLGMTWDKGLSLSTAMRVFTVLSVVALLGSLRTLRRWLHAPWWLLLLVLGTLTPSFNAIKMGQANTLVLWPALIGLASSRGGLTTGVGVGVSAMAKMSPALLLGPLAVTRDYKAVLGAVATAVALTLLALPLVDVSTQWHFYTAIMPGFSSGEYHGLRVPINLPANHSIPDLFHQLWPGPDHHHLDPKAATASKMVSLATLGAILWTGRHVKRKDALGMACLAGATTVLMVITPVYAYEHHLAWLLLPGVAAGMALWTGRLSSSWIPVTAVSWLLATLHLSWLRTLREAAPGGVSWVLQESKFVGLLGLLVVCTVAAVSYPKPTESP